MNIDTSKIKSNHWSELLLQMNAYSNCYYYARTISYQEFWDNSTRGDRLLFFAANEGSTPHKLIVKAAFAADAVYYAASATDAASKKEMQQKTADIVRSIIPMPTQAVSEFERLIKMKPFW